MLPFDPKKPLYGLKTRLPHAQRRIQFFINTFEEHVYFRPKYAPEDWWGVLGDRFFEFDAQELERKERPPHIFTQKAQRFIRRKMFFRQFFLLDPREGESRMWSIHWRPDAGRIYPIQHPESPYPAYFRPHNSRHCNLLRASTHHIKNQFLDEWNDPKSDAREALLFCDLTLDERARQVLRWECGSIHELEHLVRIACVCDSTLWKSSDFGSVLIDPTEDCPLYVHPIFYDKGQIQAMLSPRLHRVLQRICDCNRAFAQRGKNNRDLWGWPWEPELPDDMLEPQNIYVDVERPTQHEYLEATLFMRDWLRENAPDLLGDWFPNAV